jgi:hypothetical protein
VLFDYFGDLNWLAVIVAAVAYFVLGAVWYSNALFGRQYRAALGVSEGGGTPPAGPLLVNLVGWFIAAVVLGMISKAVGADDWVDGLVLGLTVAIGFIGTNRVVTAAYGDRNIPLMKVNAPYNILGYVVMGIILAVWQ